MSVFTHSATLLVLKPTQVSVTHHRSQGRRFRDVTHARVQPSGTRSWHSLANRLFMFERILDTLRHFRPRMIHINPFTTTTSIGNSCLFLFFWITASILALLFCF